MNYCEWLKQLIDGERNKVGAGYKIYYSNKEFEEFESIEGKELFLVDEKKFEDLLFIDCEKKIIEFSKSEENKDVYAVVLEIDIEVGQIGISINTNEALENTIKQHYSNYSMDRILGLSGLKYNPGDFSYRFFEGFLSNESNEILNAYYCINNEHFISEISKPIAFKSDFFDHALLLIGINIVNRLKSTFQCLNKTSDLIAYPCINMDDEILLSLIKKTNSLETINKAFPEINGYKKHLDSILKLETSRQVEIWIRAYMDFMEEKETDITLRIKELNKTRFDVKDEIIKLSEYSVPKLVELICKLGRQPEIRFEWIIPVTERLKFMNNLSEAEKANYKRNTIEGELTIGFLFMIKDIGIITNPLLEKLEELLNFLYIINKDNGRCGLNLSVLARVLYSLRPDKYPEPKINSSTNMLENYVGFGLL